MSSRLLPCGRPAAHRKQMANSEALMHLKAFTDGNGMKFSEQRWKVAEVILSGGGHLNSQEIVKRVRESHPDIGAATVYRNIKVLLEAGILRESLTNSQGEIVYELSSEEHHDHIVCLDCDEIFEFHDEQIETSQNKVVSAMKFEQIRHRHVLYARCRYIKGRQAAQGTRVSGSRQNTDQSL